MTLFGKIFSKLAQYIAAGFIAMGIEKVFEGADPDPNAVRKSIVDEIRHDIAVEVKRLSSDDAALSSTIYELKLISFISIAIIVLSAIVTTAAKLYGKVIVNRATKKSLRKVENQ